MAQTKKQKFLQKADGYAKDRKLKKAINLYKQAINEDPGDVRTRLRLSELLYQADRMTEALDVLQFVGDYYNKHGFLLKSVAVYKKMLEVDPSRTDLHGTLAQLYFQLGMAPDAIKQFKSHVRALVKRGKVVDSLYVVRSMLELDPANVPDRLMLAENFSTQGLIDEAAEDYRRVLSILERNGRSPEWGTVALRYLHHSPEDFPVRKKVVEYLLEEGDFHRALQHLHSCLVKEPQDMELLDMASRCFECLGQPDKAIIALKNLASLYRQKGLENEAQDASVRILQLDPKDEQARKSLEIGDDPEEEIEEVELEWDMPIELLQPPPMPDGEEIIDTIYEPPSFADELAQEPTLVQPVSEDLFRELGLLEEEPPADEGSGSLQTLKGAIDSRKPLSVAELEAAGVELNESDKEELDFFMSSGLTEEALTILQELYERIEGA